ncbi:MAG: hypothetical protein AB8F95_18085 [Bacteroidia bacterium]
MKTEQERKRFFNRALIVGTIFTGIFLLIFWWSTKRQDHAFYLPEDYSGWITIVHSYPGADPLPEEDGVLQVHVTDSSGIIYTSTHLEQGWSRNDFFWETPTGLKPIPKYIDEEDGYLIYLHRNEFYHFSHHAFMDELPVGADTTMWDGTHIIKYASNDRVYNPGIKTVEFWYISKKAEPITFNPPKNLNDLSDKPLREESLKD